jgi:hypothetical protein
VSEYQYYDFKAIDRALTKTGMDAHRGIATRAVITTTSFTNHYESRLGVSNSSATLIRFSESTA